jgi:hypothetical protein
MAQDRPVGFPHVGSDYSWVFLRPTELDPERFTDQGFDVVYRGESIWVLHRADPAGSTPNRPDRRLPPLQRYWFDLDDYNRVFGALAVGGLLAWPWWRLRRAWRSAASRDVAVSGLEAARAEPAGSQTSAIVVTDAPRDIADPARRVVRLAESTALGRHQAARSIAALEAAQLRLALASGPIGWVARYRPALTTLASFGRGAGVLMAVDGMVTGARTVLDVGLLGFLAATAISLVLVPLEYLAARHARGASADLDPALLSALRWRHVAEAFPVAWR